MNECLQLVRISEDAKGSHFPIDDRFQPYMPMVIWCGSRGRLGFWTLESLWRSAEEIVAIGFDGRFDPVIALGRAGAAREEYSPVAKPQNN